MKWTFTEYNGTDIYIEEQDLDFLIHQINENQINESYKLLFSYGWVNNFSSRIIREM